MREDNEDFPEDFPAKYCRCPACGMIAAHRGNGGGVLDSCREDLECDRCGHVWTEERERELVYGSAR